MAKYVELGPGQWRIDMRNTSYAGPKEQLFKGTEAEAADELKRRIEETQRRDSRDGALLPNDSPTIMQACEEFMKLQTQRAARGDIFHATTARSSRAGKLYCKCPQSFKLLRHTMNCR